VATAEWKPTGVRKEIMPIHSPDIPANQLEALEGALRRHEALWQIVGSFDDIGLPDCWLVAGVVAQTIWNYALGRPAEAGIKDADIVYFDANDLSEETELREEARLRRRFTPLGLKLDVKNEARVHLWYEKKFGYPIPSYRSTSAAIATFPTTATSIGVRWCGARLECCAPFGLDDLFALFVRPNKVQIMPAIYEAKVARWRAEWPQLTFVAWNELAE
jgi:hypothetical protein